MRPKAEAKTTRNYQQHLTSQTILQSKNAN